MAVGNKEYNTIDDAIASYELALTQETHDEPQKAKTSQLLRVAQVPPPPPDQMIHWQQCSRQNYQLSERDMHLSACVWRGHAAGQDRAGGGARGLPGEVRRRERTLPFGEMG
jgi:hypothetical protein